MCQSELTPKFIILICARAPGSPSVVKGGRRSNLPDFCFCLGLSFGRRELTQVDSKSNQFFLSGILCIWEIRNLGDPICVHLNACARHGWGKFNPMIVGLNKKNKPMQVVWYGPQQYDKNYKLYVHDEPTPSS